MPGIVHTPDNEKRGNPLLGPGQGTAGQPGGMGLFAPGGAFASQNPFNPQQPAQGQQPQQRRNTFTPISPGDPFNARRERIFYMDPGAPKQRARQDLRGDVRAYNRNQQQNAFNPSDWGNIRRYNPLVTPPANAPGSFGLDPSHAYGNPNNRYLQTPIGRNAIKLYPRAYYQLALGQAGMPTDTSTAYGRWLADQYDSLYGNYESAQQISPNLTWDKYLQGVTPNLEQYYRGQPFALRGEIPAVMGGASWLGGF